MRVGTRGSKLALAQARWVIDRLAPAGGAAFELVVVKTSGDRPGPVKQSGHSPTLGDGVFVKEIQRALLEGRVDMAVHSLKDVPTDPVEGIVTAAIPQRADPSDALVGARLRALEPGSRVGTGSPRRAAQLKMLRKDLEVVPLRGNVPTRVARVRSGEYAAVMLAAAGLARLGFQADEILDPAVVLPAPGQGALAVEVREGDRQTGSLAATIHHAGSYSEVVAERRVLRELGGGCLLPVATYARIRGGVLLLDACVTSSDGSQQVRESGRGDPGRPLALAKAVARALVRAGARGLLEA